LQNISSGGTAANISPELKAQIADAQQLVLGLSAELQQAQQQLHVAQNAKAAGTADNEYVANSVNRLLTALQKLDSAKAQLNELQNLANSQSQMTSGRRTVAPAPGLSVSPAK